MNQIRGKPVCCWMLMGYFNFPDINWEAHHGNTFMSNEFTDAVDEAFLTQHVKMCKRNIKVLLIQLTPKLHVLRRPTCKERKEASRRNLPRTWTQTANPFTCTSGIDLGPSHKLAVWLIAATYVLLIYYAWVNHRSIKIYIIHLWGQNCKQN